MAKLRARKNMLPVTAMAWNVASWSDTNAGMLPPSRCREPSCESSSLREGSGSVGQFQAVAPDDDAALLKCLDQNHDSLGIAQRRIENAGPAG